MYGTLKELCLASRVCIQETGTDSTMRNRIIHLTAPDLSILHPPWIVNNKQNDI